ncbi:MAG TPA: 2-amino-4-hydroxy-6-hydroxymethyldihydropteridine diphosphokinase, partial [Chloroflexota bacterium]|nr:2-amino-4-hydroxy-6-hydroxymethyldihydropteridine diphosphokinase [Chloroflexota bacterium]
MSEPIRGYVGLGSNLGDRPGNLRRALLRLAGTPGLRVLRVSAVYETAPWGVLNQPPFLNAVAEVVSALGPIQLVTALQVAERAIGRTATARWGPREIDLDLLLYGEYRAEQAWQRRGLAVPHASMHERAFVLAP